MALSAEAVLCVIEPIEFVPVGSGEFGLSVTTSAPSPAAAGVDPALTTASTPPFEIFVCCDPSVSVVLSARPLVVPMLAVTDPRAFDPAGSGEFGDSPTTSAFDPAPAAPVATATAFVPSVS